jgi:hypothetical protein
VSAPAIELIEIREFLPVHYDAVVALWRSAEAQAFWSRLGWNDRTDIRLMSHTASGNSNA